MVYILISNTFIDFVIIITVSIGI